MDIVKSPTSDRRWSDNVFISGGNPHLTSWFCGVVLGPTTISKMVSLLSIAAQSRHGAAKNNKARRSTPTRSVWRKGMKRAQLRAKAGAMRVKAGAFDNPV